MLRESFEDVGQILQKNTILTNNPALFNCTQAYMSFVCCYLQAC